MRFFKIRLSSGRVLGPIQLDRVCKLIRRGKITGVELAREYPEGEWKDINAIEEIAELLLKSAQNQLETTRVEKLKRQIKPESFEKKSEQDDKAGVLELSKIKGLPGTTRGGVDLGEELLPEAEAKVFDPDKTVAIPEDQEAPVEPESLVLVQDDEPTVTVQRLSSDPRDDEKTVIQTKPKEEENFDLIPVPNEDEGEKVSDQKTIVLPGGSQFEEDLKQFTQEKTVTKKSEKKKKLIRVAALLGLGLYIFMDFFLQDKSKPIDFKRPTPIRPKLPAYVEGRVDPIKSQQLYVEGLRHYVLDTVPSYKEAANLFYQSTSLDPKNVKAIALLASAYLNLIDSSNKDETYFTVISKLIELTRAKGVDLPETIIADVEFLISSNRAEAAQRKIVQYTTQNQNFGSEMFYYLALAFYHRGDLKSAARYLSQIQDSKAFSVKVFYLRGIIAERYGDLDQAMSEYQKALKSFPNHAKSRLRIAEILKNRNEIKSAAIHIDYLVTHPGALNFKDLGLSFYLQSLLAEKLNQMNVALVAAERAVVLSPDHHDYSLQMFHVKYKMGEKVEKFKHEARMYYFLGEGEKALRNGDVNQALVEFLQARQARDQSPTPLVKIGDMFRRLNDLTNARLNYKLAAEKAPKTISIWAKYISVLIDSYEWTEAQQAMDRFRKLPVPQSAIDKLAGDLYARQGLYKQAQTYYKAALGRDFIEPSVYLAYGKALMESHQFKDAPMLFALALRQDPDNNEAIINTAKCIAETESIDRAIRMLQDEVQKSIGTRAEFLNAMAELEIQRGGWDRAQSFVQQAMTANPDFAGAWKTQGRIYLQREGIDKNALEKALQAYHSYIERNPSDAEGYLERYRIFLKKTRYEDASEELGRIYAIYPKYPNLHFYKGSLYVSMSNFKAAIEEFQIELKNNPNSIPTLISLGKILNEGGAPNEALKYLNKAIQLEPKQADPKVQAGYSNYLLKNYAGAIALYQAALAYDKGNPLIYKRLGMAYRESGDRDRAAQAFRQYIEMEPDAPDKAEFAGYL